MSQEPHIEQSFYADASVYDILHAEGTAEEVDCLERLAHTFASGAPNVWLEPACGSGRLIRLAARRDDSRRVIGFDLEPRMIDYAKRRAEKAELADRHTLFVGDMTSFADEIKPNSVGFAFNVINTIRHLESDEDLLAHFEQVAKSLHPEGVYVVGISLSLYGSEMPSEDVWSGKRGRCEVKQVVNYIPPEAAGGSRIELVYSTLTVSRPSGEQVISSSYELRTYNRTQWQGVLDRSALRVIGFTDVLGDPDEPEEPGYGLWILGPR